MFFFPLGVLMHMALLFIPLFSVFCLICGATRPVWSGGLGIPVFTMFMYVRVRYVSRSSSVFADCRLFVGKGGVPGVLTVLLIRCFDLVAGIMG